MLLYFYSCVVLLRWLHISACLSDISVWMRGHYLGIHMPQLFQFGWGTIILVFRANLSHVPQNLNIQLGFIFTDPNKTIKNLGRYDRSLIDHDHLGVMIDDQLNFSEHVAFVSFLSVHALIFGGSDCPHNKLRNWYALVMSRLVDYYNDILAGLPGCVAKTVADDSRVIPLLVTLHWLPVATQWNGSPIWQPLDQHPPISILSFRFIPPLHHLTPLLSEGYPFFLL